MFGLMTLTGGHGLAPGFFCGNDAAAQDDIPVKWQRGGSNCLDMDSMLCILSGAFTPGQASACTGGSMAMYSSSGVCLFSAPAQV